MLNVKQANMLQRSQKYHSTKILCEQFQNIKVLYCFNFSQTYLQIFHLQKQRMQGIEMINTPSLDQK